MNSAATARSWHPSRGTTPAIEASSDLPDGSITPVLYGSAVMFSLTAIHMTGWLGSLSYLMIVVASVILGAIGLRINKPTVRWPWALLLCVGVLWTIASALSGSDDNLGDLTSSRSLLSDFFAIPGYLIYGIAITGLLRERRRGKDLSIVLDAVVLFFGASLTVHHLVIQPTLSVPDAWLPARLVVAAYPIAALVLLGIAAQLAFTAGPKSSSFGLILLGTTALVLGEVVWAFGEIGRLQISQQMLELTYTLVPTSLAIAMLHPDVSSSSERSGAPSPQGMTGRYAAVSLALIAPSTLVLFPGSITPLAVFLSIGLCASSAVRVALAMRAEDLSRASLLYQAMHDDLTDLPTRPLLIDEIDRRLASDEHDSVALLFIDLDRFKNVNDLMGHHVGDELLVSVADRIVRTVREDDLVARISGDEFVVLTGGLSADGARHIANRVRNALTTPFDLSGGEVMVTASIGVSAAETGSSKEASELIQEADTAMYESKLNRNDTTVFDTTMQDRVTRRIEIEQMLRHATESPELTTWFQPIIDAERKTVAGFEALLRWSINGEPVGPDEFIPIAEDSGLIIPIGAYVLDEACRQVAWWRKNIPGGSDLYVSVNLSARQVVSPGIVDTVAEALERYELPASALWLEITETVMTEDSATTAAAMTGLRMLGIRLALDDFGTGYSSLSGLQYLPVSRLKIDRRFIAGLGSNPANDKLVRCITAVAESFGLDVVAEGVETREHLALLREFDCSMIQGWLYSPAVAAEEVPRVFAEHNHVPQRRHRPVAAR